MSECLMETCQEQTEIFICQNCRPQLDVPTQAIIIITENIRLLSQFEMKAQQEGVKNEGYVSSLAKMDEHFADYCQGRLQLAMDEYKKLYKKV